MKIKYHIAILFLLLAVVPKVSAQFDLGKNLNVDLVLGVNIGATAPVPLPEEVRKIDSYNPKFNPQIGVMTTYNINEKWGIGIGATIDWKGMRVKDEVKYMYTTVEVEEGSDNKLTGYFVGKNMTNVDMTHLTIPIYGTYTFNDKWSVKLGIYAAKVLSNTFDGNVTDGYIRLGTPTGEKQEIDKAYFDFSENSRDYDFGVFGGGKFSLTDRIGCYANLTWGLLPYFYKNENPIKFKMNNIYGTVGLSYQLK
ncbi:porin family protein [Dysgonomonas sp. 25]|uniref:porin family protein n=1 Tax=Dysgonomonas sp. 25 TaxID=2302933 RepID=UPI0013D756CB|nr:porin family protein [Dysgonomonas sp. 25]NDV69609.1 PorT family protein [Dysgonomonas sp. 25]